MENWRLACRHIWRPLFGHESSSCREWDKKVNFVVKFDVGDPQQLVGYFCCSISFNIIASHHAGFINDLTFFIIFIRRFTYFDQIQWEIANFKLLCYFNWYATWNFRLLIELWHSTSVSENKYFEYFGFSRITLEFKMKINFTCLFSKVIDRLNDE